MRCALNAVRVLSRVQHLTADFNALMVRLDVPLYWGPDGATEGGGSGGASDGAAAAATTATAQKNKFHATHHAASSLRASDLGVTARAVVAAVFREDCVSAPDRYS